MFSKNVHAVYIIWDVLRTFENFSKEEMRNSSQSVLGEADEQGAFFGSPLILTPFTSGNCEGMPDTLADHK